MSSLPRSAGQYCLTGLCDGVSGAHITLRWMFRGRADPGFYGGSGLGGRGRVRWSGRREGGEPVNTDDAVKFA